MGLLALIIVIGLGGYLFRDRLAAELKLALDAQLEQRGINASYTASDFSPFRGITLSDVTVFQTSAREKAVITLSNARLRFDLWSLIQNPNTASVELSSEKGRLVLSGDQESYVFSELESELHFDRAGLQVDNLKTQFRDLHLDAAGELEWAALSDPSTTDPTSTPTEAAAADPITPKDRVLDLSPILRWLEYVPDTPDGDAELSLTFARTSEKKTFALEGQLSGKTINWGELKASDVNLEFSLDQTEAGTTRLKFPALAMQLGDGKISATGHWDFAEEQILLSSLSSSLNPAMLAPLFSAEQAAKLPDLPPYTLEASGTLNLADILESDLSGKLSTTTPFTLPFPKDSPLSVSEMNTPFTWKNRVVSLPEFTAKAGPEASLIIAASIEIALPSAESSPTSTKLTFQPFTLKRDGGELTTKGALTLPDNALTLTSLESDLDLAGTFTDLGMADPISAHAKFPAPPSITLQGRLPLNDILASDLTGTVQAPQGVLISAGEGRVATFTELATNFSLKEKQLGITGLSSKAFDGELALNAGLNLAATPLPISGDLNIKDMQFKAINEFLATGDERTGLLSGTFQGSGSGEIASLNGKGTLAIDKADFGTVPVLRKLTPLIAAITLNGWNGDKEGASVTSSFVIENGILKSDDIALTGEFYEVKSTVMLDFPQQQLAADGMVSTSGATKVITGLVGKALEVEASGSFDDFDWKLKNVPGLGTVSDLAGLSTDVIGKTLGGAGKLPGAVLDSLSGGAPVRDTTEMAKDTLKEATEIGRALLGLGKKRKAKEEEKSPPPTEPAP